MVVLPVFLQAPWVHFYPLSACLFAFLLLSIGLGLIRFRAAKWSNIGSLLVGVSASWLGGCLFWGWLREYPLFHLPVEAFALPIAIVGLKQKWRIGAGFYLASLLGTAITDLMMLLTGVITAWPSIVKASFANSSELLSTTANQLINPQSILLLVAAAILILVISNFMKNQALLETQSSSTWFVASAALSTTLWVDGLFLFTALIQPNFSGLI